MLLKSRELGELLVRNLFLGALSRRFPESVVYAFINPDTPDQARSVLLNPAIDYVLLADRVSDQLLTNLPWWVGADDEWLLKRGPITGVFLWPSPDGIWLGGQDAPGWRDPAWRDIVDNTLFRVPAAIAEDCSRRLVELGLDPDRWFVTLHIREDGSDGAPAHPGSIRELDRYVELIRHIHARGGQVVRLGDPSTTALPGLVDLSPHDDSFLLQSYACSRSRFFFGSDAAPSVLAVGFNTPAALVNVVAEVAFFTAPKNHIVATKTFELDDGRIVRDAAAAKHRVLGDAAWRHEASCHELPADELCHIADLMLERTAGSSGWVHREPRPVEASQEWNGAELERASWRATYYSDVVGAGR
jgi:putative glycosyltransferase (TIGR04372 family)